MVVAVPGVVIIGGKVPKREGVEVEEVEAGPGLLLALDEKENDIVRAGGGRWALKGTGIVLGRIGGR